MDCDNFAICSSPDIEIQLKTNEDWEIYCRKYRDQK